MTTDPARLTIVPISLRDARAFIGQHHRHNIVPRGWLFGTSLELAGVRVGVGVASRPVARFLDDGRTVEITRLCLVEGAPRNAASRLYGALCRAAKALGYVRAVTYTLVTEVGTSLRAAGFAVVAEAPSGRRWSTPSRPRTQRDLFGDERRPLEAKHRWERAL